MIISGGLNFQGTGFTVRAPKILPVQYFIVAGGGSGGNRGGGGGGAGGVLTGTAYLQQGFTATIVVGAGGLGVPCPTCPAAGAGGRSGSCSSAFGYTAIGGGGGGSGGEFFQGGTGYTNNRQGLTGGSGGGSSVILIQNCGPQVGGIGTPGQGYPGGASAIDSSAGGGGAGAAGTCASLGGYAGTGTFTTILSTSLAVTLGIGQYITATNHVWFAGGGSSQGHPGGYGGGGGGPTQPGLPNTGGGGAGAEPAGNGGSGVVILSMPLGAWSGIYSGTATITTTVGNSMVVIFKASGTFTA